MRYGKLLATSLWLCAGLHAQEKSAWDTAQLAGRVVDENNAPVAGAEITMVAPGIEHRGFSDPTGAFSFKLTQTGPYSVKAALPGYLTLTGKTVQIAAGPNELTLVLSRVRDSLESLDVSGASRRSISDKTVREQRLSSAELLGYPYRNNNDLRNAMRVLPGVVQDQNGGIHVNGAPEQSVLYTLDRFNITDPLTGTFQSRLECGCGAVHVRSQRRGSGRIWQRRGRRAGRKHQNGRRPVPLFGHQFRSRGGVSQGPHHRELDAAVQLFGTAPKREDLVFRQPYGAVRPGRGARPAAGPGPEFELALQQPVPDAGESDAIEILYAGFLGNYWTASESGLGALDPLATTVDRRASQWFSDIKDQIYLGRGSLLEFGYGSNRTFGRESPQGTEPLYLWPLRTQRQLFHRRQAALVERPVAGELLSALVFLGRQPSDKSGRGSRQSRLLAGYQPHGSGVLPRGQYPGPRSYVRRKRAYSSRSNFESSAYCAR